LRRREAVGEHAEQELFRRDREEEQAGQKTKEATCYSCTDDAEAACPDLPQEPQAGSGNRSAKLILAEIASPKQRPASAALLAVTCPIGVSRP
jgi:hypothetical protein